MDLRTKLLIGGAAVGSVVMLSFVVFGIRDARVWSTSLFLTVIGPVCLTVARLKTYMPRAHSVWRRELWNVVLGIPLAALVFHLWGFFPAMYAALEEIVWRPSEVAGGAYLEGMQVALDTAGGYMLGLILGAMVVALQAGIWIVPAYLGAKWVMKPVEDQVERFYRQKIRQSTRQVVGRSRRLTKFRVGGELAETRVQLRMCGMMLSLSSGLVTIVLLAWTLPLF